MGAFLAFIAVLVFGGCTTFNVNESGVRRSCKSGVFKYSDDTTSFECQPKQIGKENE
jgi:hypothetical protein